MKVFTMTLDRPVKHEDKEPLADVLTIRTSGFYKDEHFVYFGCPDKGMNKIIAAFYISNILSIIEEDIE